MTLLKSALLLATSSTLLLVHGYKTFPAVITHSSQRRFHHKYHHQNNPQSIYDQQSAALLAQKQQSPQRHAFTRTRMNSMATYTQNSSSMESHDNDDPDTSNEKNRQTNRPVDRFPRRSNNNRQHNRRQRSYQRPKNDVEGPNNNSNNSSRQRRIPVDGKVSRNSVSFAGRGRNKRTASSTSTSNGLRPSNRTPPRHAKTKPNSSRIAYAFNKQLTTLLHKERYSRDSVLRADAMLWERVYPYLRINQAGAHSGKRNDRIHSMSFDLVSFNIVMLAWSRMESVQGAERAHSWLGRLGQVVPRLEADSYSYGACLNAYAKSKSVTGAIAAEALLQQFTATKSLSTDSLHNAVMDAWARSGHPQAGDRALNLLRQLQSHRTVRPTQISYNTCIKAFANAGQASQAQEILDQMKASRGDRSHPNPNKVSYTTCITAWANLIKDQQQSEMPDPGKRAEAAGHIRQLLEEMEAEYSRTRDERIRPDIYTYTAVLSAQALPPLELYSRMNKYGDSQQSPNAVFLNTCIHLLGQGLEKRNGEGDMAQEATTTAQVAETLLRQMQQQEKVEKSSGSSTTTGACKVTYTSVIAVWGQVGTVEAALRAERLLDELENMWETTGNQQYLPSAKTFCSVLTAWIKAASSNQQDNPSILEKATQLETRMHRLYQRTKSPDLAPNTIIFVQLFQLIAKSRDPQAAIRAKDLLHQMDVYASEGHTQVRPDATIMGSFLNTLTKNGVENIVELASVIIEQVEEGYRSGMGHLKPNNFLYSAVLQAYAKSASQEGAMLAEELLERTKKLFREGKMYAKQTVLFYNAVIDAHARCNGGLKAAERAEELLRELWARAAAGDASLKPTIRSYNAVILAWKNSNVQDAPQRAEAILKLMGDRFESGEQDCRPDRVTMNSVVACWAKSTQDDAPIKARELLLFMEDQCSSGDSRLQPDLITFNCCIDAFARRGAAKEATAIFERMLKFSKLPDAVTLGSLRRAWGKSSAPDAGIRMKQIEKRIEELFQNQTIKCPR